MLLAAGACLEAPPGGQLPDAGSCPGADAGPRDPVRGNVIDYDFDQDTTLTEVIHDRSGNRLDGALEGGIIEVGGFHGSDIRWDGVDEPLIKVPPSPLLHIGDGLTLEMWVWRDEMGVDHGLMSTYDPDRMVGELILEIVADGLRFAVASGNCSDPVMSGVVVPAATLMVGEDQWVHVAVTWDGEDVRFYRSGVLAATEPLSAQPCPIDRPLYIGATAKGLLPFAGWLDEIKISNYVKTEEEINASLGHDPTAVDDRCGDGVLDPGEECEAGAACCDLDSCEYAGASCECAGQCVVGVCIDGAGRTADGLVALYEFEEGEGTVAADTGGSHLDLDVTGTGFSWADGSLVLAGDAMLQSGSAATSVVEACRASEELTVEAWITPNDLSLEKQVVATLGLGDGCQGFALTQEAGWLAMALSTDVTESDGEPLLDTPDSALEPALTQVVVTRSADGRRRLYLDGRVVNETLVAGKFSTWDLSQRLAVGGPITGVSPSCEDGEGVAWHGAIHRLAVFARALSPAEVGDNYSAGPDVATTLVR